MTKIFVSAKIKRASDVLTVTRDTPVKLYKADGEEREGSHKPMVGFGAGAGAAAAAAAAAAESSEGPRDEVARASQPDISSSGGGGWGAEDDGGLGGCC